jgi:hypothetical protein
MGLWLVALATLIAAISKRSGVEADLELAGSIATTDLDTTILDFHGPVLATFPNSTFSRTPQYLNVKNFWLGISRREKALERTLISLWRPPDRDHARDTI